MKIIYKINFTALLIISFLSYERVFSQQIPECSSFYPKSGKSYIISGWVKEDVTDVKSYSNNVAISVAFKNLSDDTAITPTINFRVSGYIIDGWQRIIGTFTAPSEVDDAYLKIDLVNNNTDGTDAFFDDIRVFPYNGTLKSFVYDEETQRLMAELDENNYATYYEYDQEGGLVRVKKETEKGVYTIQETRSSTTKSN
ncbi:MAG: hypothetical protein ACX93I_10080 [Winogradskyella sp.]